MAAREEPFARFSNDAYDHTPDYAIGSSSSTDAALTRNDERTEISDVHVVNEDEENYETDEEDEEFDEGKLFGEPENLRVEYLGKRPVDIIENVVEDSFLEPDSEGLAQGVISRMIIVDAANVLHGWTPLIPGTSAQPEDQKVDAAYILSVVRFFVSKGIECLVVAQHKYMVETTTEHAFILDTLRNIGILMVTDMTYDDLMLFSIAGEYDAIILSEDQFREERNDAEFITPNTRRALSLRMCPRYPRLKSEFLPKKDWWKVSRNGHFVVDHLLRFQQRPETLRKMIFVTRDTAGHRFDLVQEKYNGWLKRKDEVLRHVDCLLAKMLPIMERKRLHVMDLIPRD